MKLMLVDFTEPATLKDRTHREIFYIIKNAHNDMPPEGPRIKTEENWDLVNPRAGEEATRHRAETVVVGQKKVLSS
jgi:hypothetical protein